MTRFVVLATPRSGSCSFVGIISSHPDVFCFDEIFKNTEYNQSAYHRLGIPAYVGQDPKEYLNTYFARIKKSAVGFKLFRIPIYQKIVTLAKENEWKLILLSRKDWKQAALSYEIAIQTEQWASWQSHDFSITADIDRMKTFVQEHIEYLTWIRQNLIGYLELYYENLFNQESFDSVTDYLNVSRYIFDFTPRDYIGGKLNSEHRYKMIRNLEDVNRAFG